MKKLNKFKKEVEKCRKCSLWKTRKKIVFGEGPVSAKIMFLGEAPGKEEDKTGIPFCGRAGKLLDNLLKENKIDRKKVYITSVIKCRPPKNRIPSKEELTACRKWWQKQIGIIKPKKIILLGRVAFNTVLGLGELGDCRGRWLKVKNQLYFPTYHPAAALRFPRIKKILEKDFKKIKENY